MNGRERVGRDKLEGMIEAAPGKEGIGLIEGAAGRKDFTASYYYYSFSFEFILQGIPQGKESLNNNNMSLHWMRLFPFIIRRCYYIPSHYAGNR